MDLRTGQPLWPAFLRPPVFPPLAGDESCDVAVVGAGITGAFLAMELARRGVDTVVVDKREACMGSTAACTGLVQYEIDRRLVEITKLLGWEHAAGAYRACRRALDDLDRLVKEIGDCGWDKRPSLFLAKHRWHVRTLKEEAAARQKLGLEVSFLGAEELKEQFNITRPAALLTQVAGTIDPLKLTAGLLTVAARRNARIYASTPVNIELSPPDRHLLRTPHGRTVRCRHLVIASGYETPEQFTAIQKICELRSTYAFATAPRNENSEPWPQSAMMWELGDPYFYARPAPENRIIIGGEDADVIDADKRDALLPRKLKKLQAKLHKLFPGLCVELEFAWAGTFAQTPDGLPYIGVTPHYPGCYFALGYGGNGITFSLLAAQIIADQIEGIENPNAKLFGFDRKRQG